MIIIGGIVDSTNKIVLPFQYQRIEQLNSLRYAAIKKDDKYQIFDFTDSGYNIGKTKLMIAYLNGKCGLIDEDCRIKLPLIYKALYVHGDTYIDVLNQNNHVQIVNFKS